MIGLGLGLTFRKNANELAALIKSLYGNGEQGAMYIPQPTLLGQQVLYQDEAGTVPVTADGDPVGYMRDLSGNGNHATQTTSAARPIYRTDGTLHWLEFDGVNDVLTNSSGIISNSGPHSVYGAGRTGSGGNNPYLFASWAGTIGIGGIYSSGWNVFSRGLDQRIVSTSISVIGERPAPSPDTIYLTGQVWDGSTLHRYNDGHEVSSYPAPVTLRDKDGVTDAFNSFDFYGVVAVVSDLDSSAVASIDSYLKGMTP